MDTRCILGFQTSGGERYLMKDVERKPLASTRLHPTRGIASGTDDFFMRTLLLQTDQHSPSWIEAALRERDHDVHAYADVESARRGFLEESFPLVVLAGPFEANLDLCRWIRATESDEATTATTIVAVLDDATPSLLQDILVAGADDYVLTSLGPDRLHARLSFVERNALVKTLRARAEQELATRARQQAVVAELGRRALGGDDLAAFMNFAVRATAEALGVSHCKVLERVDAQTLVLRAAYGWPPELIGKATVGTDASTQAGYALLSTFPVVVEDLPHETRFKGTDLLHRYGILSGISIVIGVDGEPYGVLGAHDTEHRRFLKHDISFLQSVANVLADAISRRRAEDALRESEARNRAILETTVDAVITADAEGRILSFNQAAERIFGYTAAEVLGQNLKVLMPPPYREEHDGYMRSYRETGRRRIIGIGREVMGLRKDGTTFPMDLAVSEVYLGDRVIFTGIIRDITERRQLEQEILQISDQERRRIGQDLHDGLGQMLTGIGLISQNLARKLKASGAPIAEEMAEITDLIREADQYARALAKGLVPVELEANGLPAALRRLTENARRLFGITCTLEETGNVPLHDNTAAIHLYRIAQEAVSNAVKHGRATQVRVRLALGDEQVRLYVHDNGVGFPDELPAERGMGVRIMHYRARIIGATLEIWRDPTGGTVVTCTLPRNRYAAARTSPRSTSRQTQQAPMP